jgi:hypothetical protein
MNKKHLMLAGVALVGYWLYKRQAAAPGEDLAVTSAGGQGTGNAQPSSAPWWTYAGSWRV